MNTQSYLLIAKGQFFELEMKFKSETKLNRELKRLKLLHQDEVKRLKEIASERFSTKRYWDYRKRKHCYKKEPVDIYDAFPGFQKLSIEIIHI
jgi:hypothetical protein